MHPLVRSPRRAATLALTTALTGGLAATLVAASGVAIGGSRPVEDAPHVVSTTSVDDAVDHVVAISIDGLNPDAIRRLGPTRAPTLNGLVANGATTLNARTVYERTNTLPNHTSMVTGRHILGGGGHHITANSDTGGTVHRSAGTYVASMFDVVHDRGGSTAFYSSKDKFNLLDRSWDGAHGAPDAFGADDGRDKIDRYHLDSEADNVTRLLARLRTSPDSLSFVHLAFPDRAGHEHGFMSPRYLRAVRLTDAQVARIIRAVRADAKLRAHTNLVLTADHGGLGDSHSDYTKAYDYTVPFMVWGVGVPRGRDLYALNTDVRARPGTGRPTYAGRQPIRNAEVANLVTDLLDMPSVPGSHMNRRQALRVR